MTNYKYFGIILSVKGDGTHHKKLLYSTTRGMIPIEKNIVVVDEQGNEYEATYPKRAKGLVKNGRARFIDTNKICLVCPPNNMEDNNMSNTTKTTTKPKEKLTINYVLNQIEQIVKDNEYIHNALEQLASMPKSDPGDIAGQEKAKAIGDIVRCRETTNQQALRLYEKMYDDLKPREENTKNKALEMISGVVKEMAFYESEQGAQILSDMLDTIRHID